MFAAVTKLEKLRRQYNVFDGAADTWIVNTGDDRVLGIGRYLEGEKLIALFNFGDNEIIVHLGDEAPYTDLWTGEPRGASAVAVKPKDFAWLLAR